MTSRYDLLLASIARSSTIVTMIALAAIVAITADYALDWCPPSMSKIAKPAYRFSLLFIFVVVIILGAWSVPAP